MAPLLSYVVAGVGFDPNWPRCYTEAAIVSSAHP